MYRSLPLHEAQVELSEETKAEICLGNPIVRIVVQLVRVGAGGVGPVDRHVLSGESLQTEDQGECGQAWTSGGQV